MHPDPWSEQARGARQHQVLVADIKSQFPGLTDGQKRYVQNRVGNICRRYKGECFDASVSAKPFDDRGHTRYFSFQVDRTTVYVMLNF